MNTLIPYIRDKKQQIPRFGGLGHIFRPFGAQILTQNRAFPKWFTNFLPDPVLTLPNLPKSIHLSKDPLGLLSAHTKTKPKWQLGIDNRSPVALNRVFNSLNMGILANARTQTLKKWRKCDVFLRLNPIYIQSFNHCFNFVEL